MILTLRPVGRGNWKTLTISVEGSRATPLLVRINDRIPSAASRTAWLPFCRDAPYVRPGLNRPKLTGRIRTSEHQIRSREFRPTGIYRVTLQNNEFNSPPAQRG